MPSDDTATVRRKELDRLREALCAAATEYARVVDNCPNTESVNYARSDLHGIAFAYGLMARTDAQGGQADGK